MNEARHHPGYVHALRIESLPDELDPAQVWQSAVPFLRGRRLLRLLDEHPAHAHGAPRGAVFSHVEISVNADLLEHDRRVGRGQRAEALCQGLARLHEQAFRERDWVHPEVRYRVRGDEQLPPGTLEVRFGHAVHVAAALQDWAWTVEGSPDGVIWSPVARLASDQRLLLLGESLASASCVPPGWPFGAGHGVILINEADASEVDVAPEPSRCLQVRPDPAGHGHRIEADGARYWLRITRCPAARRAAPQAGPRTGPRAGPRADPHSEQDAGPRQAGVRHRPDQDAASAVFRAGPRGGATHSQAPDEGATLVPGMVHAGRADPSTDFDAGTLVAAGALPRLCLAGLALQRVSGYRQHGVQAVRIGLDRQLRIVVAAGGDAARAALVLTVDSDDQLQLATAAGQRRLDLPEKLAPFGGEVLQFELPPEPLRDRYVAFLLLPQAPSVPLGLAGRQVFGRDAPALRALRVLADSGFVDGTDTASGDRMGVSRRAFSFELEDQDLVVHPESDQQRLYHLDADRRWLATVGQAAGTAADTAAVAAAVAAAGHAASTAAAPGCHIVDGEHLVVGHYLLRFAA